MSQYELNLLDYWLIIKKRKFLILLTTALVVAFTFLMTQALKSEPLYQASARVKFDRTTTVTDMILESFTYSWGNDWSTQSEVVRSLPVIEQAAKTLGLIPPDAPEEVRRSKEYLRTIYALQARITAKPEGDTAIIRITATAADPDEAEKIANAVAEAYRFENIRDRNRTVTQSLAFVEKTLRERENRLSEAEEALRAFKEREGQVFLTDEAKAALASFTALEEEYNKVLRVQDQTRKQMRTVRKQQASGGANAERIFTEHSSEVLSLLNTRLLKLIQERTGLLIDYTPEHPKVRLRERQIENVRLEMLRELTSKLKSLNTHQAILQDQIEMYRERYLAFPQAAIHLSRLDREVKVNTELYAKLKLKQQELLIKTAERVEEVTLIAPAVASQVAVNTPDQRLNLIIGTVMGLFLGVVLAFTRESFDTSIGTIEGIEEFLKVPVLGVIPQFDPKQLEDMAAKALPPNTTKPAVEMFSRLPTLVDPGSMLSENLRSLRTNLQFASIDKQVKSILFSSVGLGEGKSTTIINLAITLSQEGQRVLLVDGDLRKPTIHRRLGLKREPGLAEALIGATPWRTSVRTVTDLMLGLMGVDLVMNAPGLDNLHVLTSGRASRNPAEFLRLDRISALITDMQDEYDLVLFDTPPILPVTDAVTISSKVDGTILVYQVGRIGRKALRRAKFLLDHAKANVLGVVLTNVSAEIAPEYSYLDYQYR